MSQHNPALGRFNRSVVLIVLLWSTSTMTGADATASRNWRDASGKFTTTAQFVRRLGTRVVLRGDGGKELEVPYSRLSAPDREYVDARVNAPSPVPPAVAAGAHLVVTLSESKRVFSIYPGTVFAEVDGFRYIAVGPIRADRIVGYVDTANGVAHAIVDSGGESRRVALEKISFNEHSKLILLRAPKKDLPAPFDPPSTPPTLARGDVIWFLGHEIRMEAAQPLVATKVVEAVVRENFVNLQGEPRAFQAEAVGTTKAPQGVFVDSRGAPISLAGSALLRPEMMRGDSMLYGRQNFDLFRSISMEPLESLLAPEVLVTRSKLNYLNDAVELVVQVQLVDLQSAAKPVKLKLLGVNGDDDLSYRPDRFHFEDGRWSDKPESTGVEIELQKVPQIDPQVEYSLQPADWPHMQIWVGKIRIPNDTTPRNFSYQCVYVEADGKFRPLGTSGQFFYRVSSDELQKRR